MSVGGKWVPGVQGSYTKLGTQVKA